MSGTSKNSSGFEIERQANCRVAYTIDNYQPVSCTIIGDQPLFYMDYEGDFIEDLLEEESMFDSSFDMHESAEAKMLEKELAALKHELELMERFSEDFTDSRKEKCENFASLGAELCAPQDVDQIEQADITKILCESRIASAYLAEAKKYDVDIVFSSQIETGLYDRNAGTIFINPVLGETDQVLVLARELRRHWQHRQGALINPLMFDPDNSILINRVQEADLTVSVVRIAWELQLSGYKEAWARLENSGLADLGHALAREAFLDFRTLNNGVASAAVFETWFISDRCEKQDKKLIQQMLADNENYVFDMADGHTSLTPSIIAALGSMPYGKNYLAQHAAAIMDDPVFAEVRDRSNANFLWFIKFERTCRETEQELQARPDLSTGDVHTPGSQSGIKGSGNGKENTKDAEVVQLYSEQTQPERRKGKLLDTKSGSGQGAEIVYLRRWSGE